jgi:DNA repair protein RadD
VGDVLRPYQAAAVDYVVGRFESPRATARAPRIILAAPTGSGKTHIAAAIIEHLRGAPGGTMFITDRITLSDQAYSRLSDTGLATGLMQGEKRLRLVNEDVLVGTAQTFARRLLDPPAIAFIDEVHYLHGWHRRMLDAWLQTTFVGLTATPERKGLAKYFDDLQLVSTIGELIELGYLVPFKCYGPSTPDLTQVRIISGDYHRGGLSQLMSSAKIVGDVVATWQRMAADRKTIVFGVDIAHVKELVAAFAAEGVRAAAIHQGTPDEERRRAIEQFENADLQVLASVAVLSVGFDAPATRCVVLARPTLSLALHIQQAGRGCRTAPDKDDVVILDHAGNCARHGLPQHYIPSGLRGGDQQSGGKRAHDPAAAPCPECSYIVETGQRECPQCGFRKRAQPAVVALDGELIALNDEPAPTPTDRLEFYRELRGYGGLRNYKPGWAAHKFKERYGGFPPWSWNDEPEAIPSAATVRWVKSRLIAHARAMEAA